MRWFEDHDTGEAYTGDQRDCRDLEIPERPSAYHNWANREWRFDREAWLDTVIRPERDRLLDEADLKYCNSERWDLMGTGSKAAWREYKQALRDLPDTINFGDPAWPMMRE